MRTADRDRTAIEAAQLFIDMLETRNSRVGIVEFTNVLHTEIPLTPVNTLEEREELKSVIAGFQYGGWTDIGLALRSATEMLMNHGDPDNSPMIILFTDGDIELGPNQDVRTEQMSYEDVWWSVDSVEGIAPIYTIGLNYHGDVNINFLRTISDRTLARSFIIEEAGGLPVVFSEIFASHIRSSITEIAEFVAEGDVYAEVIIPISSAFVAEANIIMLSEHPLESVRLVNPYGEEVVFDGINHILTYANRYSMIKSINPALGDWTLHVMGLADDRITVNLIYSFDVNLSISVSQENVAGALYNPQQPVQVAASFIFADPRIDPSELYAGAEANLHVYNSAMQLQYTVQMINTGTNFVAEYLTATDLETVHLQVAVTHPAFGLNLSSAYVSVNYGAPEEFEPVQQEPEPTPTPTPTPPPVVPEEPASNNSIIPIIVVVIAVIAAGLIFFYKKQQGSGSGNMFFSGYLEVRALLDDGNYTALEAPDLSTFPGRTALYDFLNLSLKSQSDKILNAIDVSDVYIQPGVHAGEVVIKLQNKGNCKILDYSENVIDAKSQNFDWLDNQKLIFTNGDNAKIEITYRVTED